MLYYRLLHRTERLTCDVEAVHECSFPGVSCDACGQTWAQTGIGYPTLAGICRVLPKRPTPLPIDQFLALKRDVQSLVRPDTVIAPGVGFGPLRGRIGDTPSSVQWATPWTLLVADDVLIALGERGVRLPRTAPAILRHARGTVTHLHELELEPRGTTTAAEQQRATTCTRCGRTGVRWPDDVVLVASSLDEELDVFRLGDMTTMIVASERFMEALQACGLHIEHECLSVE
jgi:uncharacterized double-CXXCG motif protein